MLSQTSQVFVTCITWELASKGSFLLRFLRRSAFKVSRVRERFKTFFFSFLEDICFLWSLSFCMLLVLRGLSFIGLPWRRPNETAFSTRFFSGNSFLVFLFLELSRTCKRGSDSLISDSFDLRSWDLDIRSEPFTDGRPCSMEYRE